MDDNAKDIESISAHKRTLDDDANGTSEPPRKKPVTKERQRVSRACDACKRKKARCTGTLPCPTCEKNKLWCTYDAAYARGKHPPPPPTKSPAVGLHATTLESSILNQASTPDNDVSTTSVHTPAIESQAATTRPFSPSEPQVRTRRSSSTEIVTHLHVQNGSVSTVPARRNSPMPTQIDSQGHYVGSSSGIAFLSRARNRLRRTVSPSTQDAPSSSSIFSFGDAPLPDCDATGFMLPSNEDAIKLISRYFEYSMPTHRFLHLDTVLEWQRCFFLDPQRYLQDNSSKGKNAVLFMVLAIAKASEDNNDMNSGKLDGSFQYYQAAERQLQGETGRIRLASVQARLCQCFYLLSQSCVNRAWNLFGTVTRLIHALGLHRKQVADAQVGDMVERECRKRTFWCAYVLDRYLGSMMGRPCALHDIDIDQNLPEAVDDKGLHQGMSTGFIRNRQTDMHACIAHIQLARILSEILQTQYGLRPLGKEVQDQATQRFRLELNKWAESLPVYLDPTRVNPDSLPLLWQRQCTTLILALSHARILAFRPFVVEYNVGSPWSVLEPMANCVDAALTAINAVDSLVKRQQLQSSFWFSQYVGFSAVVVLYTHYNSSVSRNNLPAAERCAAHLRSIAIPHSLCQRYVSVIDALRAEPRTNKQSLVPSGIVSRPRATVIDYGTWGRLDISPSSNASAAQVTPQSVDVTNRSGESRAVEATAATVNEHLSADLQYTDEYWTSSIDANLGGARVTNWMDFDSFVLDPMHFE